MRYSTFHTLHIGAAHVRRGLPCQDMCLSESDDRFSIAVVSDGHGSRRHFRSEHGARFACEIALARIRAFLEQTESWTNEERQAQLPELKQQICEDWRSAVLDDLQLHPWSQAELDEQRQLLSDEQLKRLLSGKSAAIAYGCTLCAVFTAPWGWGALQVGDGCVTVIEADGAYRWPMPESLINEGNLTASLCSENPLEDFRDVLGDGHPIGLMAYTDGIEKSFPSQGKEIVSLLYRVWKNQRFGDENRLEQLTRFLGEVTRRSPIGDDVSIAGIIDRDAEDVAPLVSDAMRMQELRGLEAQRKELLTTVEYNRRRLQEVLRDAPGSEAEEQIRRILDRREADLTAMTDAVNAKRAQLGMEPLPEEEIEIPEEETWYPQEDVPQEQEDVPPEDMPQEEAPQNDAYFWSDDDEEGDTSLPHAQTDIHIPLARPQPMPRRPKREPKKKTTDPFAALNQRLNEFKSDMGALMKQLRKR